jgi:hypothetical protein
MLHIHNGDATADTARQTSLPGEHFAWRESLITGPTPLGLSADEWRLMRARHLSAAYGVDLQQCQESLVGQDQKLASAVASHDELVLWFEHDLFCQIHLIYLLDSFASQSLENTTLSLICIDRYPGKNNFRGLGELSGNELIGLFPNRQEVTTDQLGLATSALRAYCSDDPTAIEIILRVGTSALPFLDAALRAHLRRFPATSNGLGHIESRVLELIAGGVEDFGKLFAGFGDEESIYGLGDAQFWLALRHLCNGPAPLISVENFQTESLQRQTLTSDLAQKAKFKITAAGEAGLANAADFITLNGIELWLGGVHLHDPENLWRWDDRRARLQFSSGPSIGEIGY